jgi:hypothetical protein
MYQGPHARPRRASRDARGGAQARASQCASGMNTAAKTPVAPVAYQPTAADRHGPDCNCSNCAPFPIYCPEGCPCIVCLVDKLSARPAPRMKSAE